MCMCVSGEKKPVRQPMKCEELKGSPKMRKKRRDKLTGKV